MADGASFLSKFNPEGKQGGLLLFLNAAGMVFATISNTFAVATDKNTKPEDKKIIKNFETKAVKKFGEYVMENGKETFKKGSMSDEDVLKNAKSYAIKQIEKAQKKIHFFGKDNSKEVLKDMVDTFFVSNPNFDAKQVVQNNKGNLSDALKGANITELAKESYIKDGKAAASVLGAFTGAIIGAAILTPIIRDISAYLVQKKMEKNNPELKNEPPRPYFDPSHVRIDSPRRIANMREYMVSTKGSLKI